MTQRNPQPKIEKKKKKKHFSLEITNSKEEITP